VAARVRWLNRWVVAHISGGNLVDVSGPICGFAFANSWPTTIDSGDKYECLYFGLPNTLSFLFDAIFGKNLNQLPAETQRGFDLNFVAVNL